MAELAEPAQSCRFAVDHYSAANMFVDDISDIVKSVGNNRYYVRSGIPWESVENILLNKVVMKRCLQAGIYKASDDDGDLLPLSGNVPSAKRIIKASMAFLAVDPCFEQTMWESNIGVLCFRNGMFDFRARSFNTYDERPDVFPTLVIQRDFPVERPPQELIDEVGWGVWIVWAVCYKRMHVDWEY